VKLNDRRLVRLRMFGKQHQNFTANLDELDRHKDSASETISAACEPRFFR
jgi:hypothetical protein